MSSSQLLYSLFDQCVKQTRNEQTHTDVSSISHNYMQRTERLHGIKHDAINEAMTKVELMVRQSIAQCAKHIQQTLTAIDNMSATDNTFIEQELLMSQAQMLTAASALKQFHAQITCAITNAQMCTRNKTNDDSTINLGSGVIRQISSWFANKVQQRSSQIGKNKRIHSDRQQFMQKQISIVPSVDYYKHFDVILTVLQSSVSRWRLQLVLCKEQLALYKNELVLFGHAGVLSCSQADITLLNEKLAKINSNANNGTCANIDNDIDSKATTQQHHHDRQLSQSKHDSVKQTNARATGQTQGDELQPHFGLVTSVSHHTRWLLNDLVKLATGSDNWDAQDIYHSNTNVDKAKSTSVIADIHSASKHQQQYQQLSPLVDKSINSLHNDNNNNNDTAQSKCNNVSSNVNLGNGTVTSKKLESTRELVHMTQNIMSNPEQIMYSPDEQHVLQQQMMVLREEQVHASANDAKQIETAVRELSQLTSLMDEQIMLQSEQFDVVLKNTEAAQRTMSRAVREVDKASQHFWNSTRQLIVLLWLCTLVLIIANWLQSQT